MEVNGQAKGMAPPIDGHNLEELGRVSDSGFLGRRAAPGRLNGAINGTIGGGYWPVNRNGYKR
jgi:hypothetical protein